MGIHGWYDSASHRCADSKLVVPRFVGEEQSQVKAVNDRMDSLRDEK